MEEEFANAYFDGCKNLLVNDPEKFQQLCDILMKGIYENIEKELVNFSDEENAIAAVEFLKSRKAVEFGMVLGLAIATTMTE